MPGAVGFNLSMVSVNLAAFLIFDGWTFILAAGLFLIAAYIQSRRVR